MHFPEKKAMKLSLTKKSKQTGVDIKKTENALSEVFETAKLNVTSDFKKPISFSPMHKDQDFDNEENVTCHVCNKNLSLMNSQRKMQHLNRCIDKVEENDRAVKEQQHLLQSARTAILGCPICGKICKTELSRLNHLKKCSQSMGVPTEKMIKLIKDQEDERTKLVVAGIMPPECSLKRPSVKMLSAKGKKRKLKEPKNQFEEDVQVAMAISSSLIDKNDSCQVIGGQVSKVARKSKKTKLEDVCLLTTLSDADRKRRMEEKVNNILSQEFLMGQIYPKRPGLQKSKIKARIQPNSDADSLWLRANQVCSLKLEQFYVTNLMPPIMFNSGLPEKFNKRLLCIPGREQSFNAHDDDKKLEDSQRVSIDGDVITASTQTVCILAELAMDSVNMQLRLNGSEGITSQKHNEKGHTDRNCLLDDIQASGFCTDQLVLNNEDKLAIQTEIFNEYRTLVNNPEFSDVRLVTTDGQTFSAHRVILSARCPLLLKLMENSEIDLNVSAVTALALLNYLYTGDVTISQPFREEFVDIADRLSLTALKEACSKLVLLSNRSEYCTNESPKTPVFEDMNYTISKLDLKEIWGESESEVDSDDDIPNTDNAVSCDNEEIDADGDDEFMCSQKYKQKHEESMSNTVYNNVNCHDSELSSSELDLIDTSEELTSSENETLTKIAKGSRADNGENLTDKQTSEKQPKSNIMSIHLGVQSHQKDSTTEGTLNELECHNSQYIDKHNSVVVLTDEINESNAENIQIDADGDIEIINVISKVPTISKDQEKQYMLEQSYTKLSQDELESCKPVNVSSPITKKTYSKLNVQSEEQDSNNCSNMECNTSYLDIFVSPTPKKVFKKSSKNIVDLVMVKPSSNSKILQCASLHGLSHLEEKNSLMTSHLIATSRKNSIDKSTKVFHSSEEIRNVSLDKDSRTKFMKEMETEPLTKQHSTCIKKIPIAEVVKDVFSDDDLEVTGYDFTGLLESNRLSMSAAKSNKQTSVSEPKESYKDDLFPTVEKNIKKSLFNEVETVTVDSEDEIYGEECVMDDIDDTAHHEKVVPDKEDEIVTLDMEDNNKDRENYVTDDHDNSAYPNKLVTNKDQHMNIIGSKIKLSDTSSKAGNICTMSVDLTKDDTDSDNSNKFQSDILLLTDSDEMQDISMDSKDVAQVTEENSEHTVTGKLDYYKGLVSDIEDKEDIVDDNEDEEDCASEYYDREACPNELVSKNKYEDMIIVDSKTKLSDTSKKDRNICNMSVDLTKDETDSDNANNNQFDISILPDLSDNDSITKTKYDEIKNISLDNKDIGDDQITEENSGHIETDVWEDFNDCDGVGCLTPWIDSSKHEPAARSLPKFSSSGYQLHSFSEMAAKDDSNPPDGNVSKYVQPYIVSPVDNDHNGKNGPIPSDILLDDNDDSFVFQVDENLKILPSSTAEHIKYKTPTGKGNRQKKTTAWLPPSPFTPMPEYHLMATPHLKREVSKFGVKPVSKKRMITVLQDIYEKTHQYETDSDIEADNAKKVVEKVPRISGNSTKPNLPNDNNLLCPKVDMGSHYQDVDSDSDSDQSSQKELSCTQESSESDLLEESCVGLYLNSGESDTSGSPQKNRDVNKLLFHFIKHNPELHTKVLMYEPLELDVFKRDIKAAGIKCSLPKLIDFLDEQSIAFTTKNCRKQTYRKRGQHKKKPSKAAQQV